MNEFDRRRFLLAAAAAVVAGRASAQAAMSASHGHYESLVSPGRIGLPEIAAMQHVTDSPAPRAAQPGRWIARAPLPLPRSEMAWATEHAGRMHVVGGYGAQRVDRPYHHVYDPAADRWARIAPLPRACGAVACVALNGRLHGVGGAVGDTFATKKSVDWHLVYDPQTDRWDTAAPMPTGRDHTGTLVVGASIHVVGGRVDSFHTNSNLHHAWDAQKDRWEPRRPLPTARSGHGAVLYRGKIFVMGGEGTDRVYGQNEAWDPATDRWEAYAPMRTPRHGLGVAVVGDFIHAAGGGPVMGGGVQSAVHEAFTLG